jgi:hypothetical protein
MLTRSSHTRLRISILLTVGMTCTSGCPDHADAGTLYCAFQRCIFRSTKAVRLLLSALVCGRARISVPTGRVRTVSELSMQYSKLQEALGSVNLACQELR